MPNTQNLKPFQKGDPRINRKGRPKNADVMRQVANDLCYEPVDLSTDSVARSHLESIMRDWLTSGDLRKQRAVLEIAFGRVPTHEKPEQELGKVIIEWDDGHIIDSRQIGTAKQRSQVIRSHSLSLWRHRRSLAPSPKVGDIVVVILSGFMPHQGYPELMRVQDQPGWR